jgi:hypothetical protein
MEFLEGQLSGKEWLTGSDFTVSDVAVGCAPGPCPQTSGGKTVETEGNGERGQGGDGCVGYTYSNCVRVIERGHQQTAYI